MQAWPTACRSIAPCPPRTTRSTARRPKGEHYLLEVDNPLVVPVGKKVRVLITANDVLHAWWVPAFGVKQDAVPGFIRDAWFKVDKPGTYPRPVRRTLRQGTRFHADRRGAVEPKIRRLGCKNKPAPRIAARTLSPPLAVTARDLRKSLFGLPRRRCSRRAEIGRQGRVGRVSPPARTRCITAR